MKNVLALFMLAFLVGCATPFGAHGTDAGTQHRVQAHDGLNTLLATRCKARGQEVDTAPDAVSNLGRSAEQGGACHASRHPPPRVEGVCR